ncbi:DUF488 domain-containing protein [Massilia cavernae]|uniref:DUF488 domain-containing protein n=1 Tax=Massilia cavernae TaxID=2320864 RepID=A0A418XR53_9BURK|nr:DUF488 domain-containing protein [Massilia cavernae]RJG14993.1 DUF488 domain-containing protein [Massilia cavernae]
MASNEHTEQALDEALRESFPASDPVAIDTAPPVAQRQCNLAPLICTIGHSNRPIETFLDLLKRNEITRLLDVRTVPGSRHNPQFGKEQLAASLGAAGISYTHVPGLGGLRRARPESPNAGWRNASFRAYADYMQTDAFRAELEQLASAAGREHCVLMCAEAVPWRCHRSLIADALLIRGVRVEHIIGPHARKQHALTPFARVTGMCITYPAPTPDF